MNNRRKKNKKSTQQNADKLAEIRRNTGYDQETMALALGLKYRTYQDYEYGKRPLPGDLLDRARDVQKRDRASMRKIIKNIDRLIAKRYPTGIPSEVEREE